MVDTVSLEIELDQVKLPVDIDRMLNVGFSK